MLPDDIRETLHQHNDVAKHAAFEALHKAYGRVRVVLRPNSATREMGFPEDVIKRYAGSQLPLDVGMSLARPTAFKTFEDLLIVRLSFGGCEGECMIPWRAVEVLQTNDCQEAFAWNAIRHAAEVPVAAEGDGARRGLRVIKGGAA